MRRSDKEIDDPSLLDKILKRALICRIGLIDGNKPYIVPMNFGYLDGCIYLHSASEGRKIEALKKNNQVCFQIDCKTELIRAEQPCQYGMKYYSIIGWGKIKFLENFTDKSEALNILIDKYAPDQNLNLDRKQINNINLLELKIDEITGKKSGH
jgi:nitroimidazol reductase NimA-like FMN-containing flavoprotein (pyridoxamine 5'-phosphate oxidase superfamily)